MVIRIEPQGTKLFARYETETGETITVDVSVYLALSCDGLRLLRSFCDYIGRLRPRSFVNYLRVVVLIGRAVIRAGVLALPSSEPEWQELALRVYREILSDPTSKARLKTRATITYPAVRALLDHLQKDGIIPLSTIFPESPKNRLVDVLLNPTAHLLGETQPAPIETFNTKLLCDISLSRSDAEFLDEIREKLLFRRHKLRDGLIAYWKSMKSHMVWGSNAIKSTDTEALLNDLAANGSTLVNEITTHGKKYRYHYLSPISPEGLSRLIAIFEDMGGVPTHREVRASKILPRTLQYDDRWCYPDGVLPLTGPKILEWQTRARWFLGKLSQFDIAILSAILIMEHPRFTPEAITQARIEDKNGKLTLEIGDFGDVLALPKHRARKQKHEHLSSLAREIVRFVVDMTTDIRKHLKQKNSPLADLLFIPFNQSARTPVAPNHQTIIAHLSGCRDKHGRSVRWIGDYQDCFELSGLDRGSVTFAKIRNTEGVLEWFRTGSIGAMARKLGNKSRTALDHYLPHPLLIAWSTRLIRRFQNLWITTAAFEEDYLLEATDFATTTELQRFIAQMLDLHPSETSPLALELHARAAKASGANSDDVIEASRASLSMNISKNSLAALYVFSDSAMMAGMEAREMDKCDPDTGISIRMLIELSTLMKHRLPNHEMIEFRRINAEANNLANRLSKQLNWSNLFVSNQR